MSRVAQNSLEIIEKNIQELKDRAETLSAADLRRMEMLVNIRRILLVNGNDSESSTYKYQDVTDEEILEELSKPEEKIKIPRKPRGKKTAG